LSKEQHINDHLWNKIQSLGYEIAEKTQANEQSLNTIVERKKRISALEVERNLLLAELIKRGGR